MTTSPPSPNAAASPVRHLAAGGLLAVLLVWIAWIGWNQLNPRQGVWERVYAEAATRSRTENERICRQRLVEATPSAMRWVLRLADHPQVIPATAARNAIFAQLQALRIPTARTSSGNRLTTKQLQWLRVLATQLVEVAPQYSERSTQFVDRLARNILSLPLLSTQDSAYLAAEILAKCNQILELTAEAPSIVSNEPADGLNRTADRQATDKTPATRTARIELPGGNLPITPAAVQPANGTRVTTDSTTNQAGQVFPIRSTEPRLLNVPVVPVRSPTAPNSSSDISPRDLSPKDASELDPPLDQPAISLITDSPRTAAPNHRSQVVTASQLSGQAGSQQPGETAPTTGQPVDQLFAMLEKSGNEATLQVPAPFGSADLAFARRFAAATAEQQVQLVNRLTRYPQLQRYLWLQWLSRHPQTRVRIVAISILGTSREENTDQFLRRLLRVERNELVVQQIRHVLQQVSYGR